MYDESNVNTWPMPVPPIGIPDAPTEVIPVAVVAKEDDGTYEYVQHPKHYNNHPSGVECIDIAERMGFNIGNAFKYVYRRNSKADAQKDVEKAIFYVEREIGRLNDVIQVATKQYLTHMRSNDAFNCATVELCQRVIDAEAGSELSDLYAYLFEVTELDHYVQNLTACLPILKRLLKRAK